MEPLAAVPSDLRGSLEAFATSIERSPHNLMSARGRSELRSRHLPECLALAAFLPPRPLRVLDVGSGAGLPGLVVALARPDADVWLLDATRKKADFLRSTASALQLANVTVVHARAEDLVGTMGSSFDRVTARAVAPLHRLVAWTVPFLREQGCVLAVKGEQWRAEVEDAAAALERHDAVVVGTPDDPLPDDMPVTDLTPRVVTLARRSSS